MRLIPILCGVTALVSALVLPGSGIEREAVKELDVDSPGMAGRAFGGEQPVAGATVSVIAKGTSGYGSTGTVLASVTTDIGGNFRFLPCLGIPNSLSGKLLPNETLKRSWKIKASRPAEKRIV